MLPALQLLKRFCQPGANPDGRTERRDVEKLCEVGKIFLAANVREMVAQHDMGRPLVRFYSSDGTPLLLNRQWVRQLGGTTVRRRGKACEEFMVERTYWQTIDHVTGKEVMSVQYREPYTLSSGKKVGTSWLVPLMLLQVPGTFARVDQQSVCMYGTEDASVVSTGWSDKGMPVKNWRMWAQQLHCGISWISCSPEVTVYMMGTTLSCGA